MGDSSSDISFVFYRYDPSLPAAVIFVVLFVVASLVHLFQLFRYKTWYFIPFVIGGICEFIGYIGRIQSAQETPDWTKGPYIIQSLLILIAPTLFSASIYMILGRLIRLLDAESHSVIRTRWLTKIFVTSDIISFFAQGGGGGILASSKDMSGFEKGENVIIGGLFIQLVGFGTFMIVTALFHRRLLRYPTNASRAIGALWQRYLFVLYFVSAMILIRSIFRVIEYIQGYDGTLQSTEIWLYIFDATLMFLAMVALNVYHPSRIIGVKVKRGQELGTDLSHELLP